VAPVTHEFDTTGDFKEHFAAKKLLPRGMTTADNPRTLQVIAPSLGMRFSGINASMIAVLPELANRTGIAALGFNIPETIPQITFLEFLRASRDGTWRIWHARRNIDMLAGLVLRKVFRFRLRLVFTSAAQREHSWITRFYYRHMDAVIATSQAAAGYLKRDDIKVVRHGVNTEIFSPPADRASTWSAHGLPGKYGISIFGRIRPQKGTEEFVLSMIEVLRSRPDWTAVIVGATTPEFQGFERRLRSSIEAAGLAERFHFTGYIKRFAAIPEWYRASTVVVCASHNEGFGLSCLEAMASGCAVVATRTGAWPELIDDGKDGFLVNCADTRSLTEALQRITSDPRHAEEMGRKAREKVLGEHGVSHEANGISDVYRSLLAGELKPR